MNFELAVDAIRLYTRSPLAMVRELFKVEPDLWQREVLEDFPHNPLQAMLACKGPGKTTCLAWLAWNFLLTRPHPKIGAVSITGKNLHDNLWPEMAKWMKVAPVLERLFDWTSERIFLREHPETWFMSAKAWSQSANEQQLAETLAGLWAAHVMFLMDEAGGIPVPVLRTALAALQREGTEGHIVMAGNTTSVDGCLYEAGITRRHLWRVYEITADPDDLKRTPRISIEYARQQIAEYGRDDPWVMVNLLGKFPTQGINQLISADQVRECLGRHLHQHAYDWAPKIAGGDVADMGDDRTVLFLRQGLRYWSPLVLRHMDPIQIAGHWIEKINQWGGVDSCQVDATGGYGAGPIALLRQHGQSVTPVNFSEKPLNPKFYNKRAENWWNACEHIKGGASLPDDCPELVHELSSATYSYKRDKILIEDKKLIKARLGKSPDLADALCCTHAFPVATTRAQAEGLAIFDLAANVSKARTDYDPLSRP